MFYGLKCFGFAKKILPMLSIPIFLSWKKQNYWCLQRNELLRNKIDNRIYTQVEVSNSPCQDRNASIQLTSINGYAAAVYDGHGGWQSHFISKILLQQLDKSIQKNKQKFKTQQQLIKHSIVEAFQICEEKFLKIAKEGYDLGFGRFGRAGSCALVCVVANNKVYTGNAGDSLGIIIEQVPNQQIKYKELNRQLNANNPQQRQRLKQLFPLQQDIVVCKKQNMRSCYVKGRLQPTRSIGDLRLKHPQFNNPKKFSRQHDFQPSLEVFTGPYINWEPEITVFNLSPFDKCIVLASDGLWDQLGKNEVSQMLVNKQCDQLSPNLMKAALQNAAINANMSVQQLKLIPNGKKRDLHDDITIVVIDLKNQYQ